MTALVGAPALAHPAARPAGAPATGPEFGPVAGEPEPVVALTFPHATGHRAAPGLRALWADRLAGGAPTPLAGDGPGRSFAGMCAALLHRLPAGTAADLVVLAHVTPDLDPRDSVAGALAAPGRLVFAVSDQGRLAPFTALRIAAALPDRARAVVIALDQSRVPYRDPDLSALDGRADHAVALRPDLGFGPVRQWAAVGGDRLDDRLAAALADERPDLVILGPALPPLPGRHWRRAPGDHLGTAVFSALAAVLDRPAPRPRRITVVEYEPATAGLALVTWAGRAPAAGHPPVPAPESRPDPSHHHEGTPWNPPCCPT